MHRPRLLLAFLFLVTVLPAWAAAPSHAAWPHDPNVNVPLCSAPGNQQYVKIVADGTGGVIVVWCDRRGGNYDIYAQRVDAAGVPRWMADGVPLCSAASDQMFPMIATDGSGGAIVVWHDYRSGNTDIYAQRVSAAGVPQWTADGVPLCSAAREQDTPTIATDGSGGAIVTWCDYRSGSYDVYAQRVSAAGAPQWTADGVALCTGTAVELSTVTATDGSGGAIVAWYDRRGADYDVYTQRVSAAGAPQWTANGVALCTATGHQGVPTIIADGSGGAVVTWYDARSGTNFDIYAQRVSAAGVPQWTADGVALCTATNNQLCPTIATDGASGAIVAWYDVRGGGNYDIYAQRVNGAGVVQWTANGVALCTAAGDQKDPVTVEDGAGGAIVTWYDSRVGGSDDIYAQRVNGVGAVQGTANGSALCTMTNDQVSPAIAGDGQGGGIVAWADLRGGGVTSDVYAQRIEHFGYLGSPEPLIASVTDVPNDQGGRVKLSWDASWLDRAADTSLTAYDVLRSVPSSLVVANLARGSRMVSMEQVVANLRAGDIVTQSASTQTYYWEYLATVTPVHYLTGYSYLAATASDSVAGSNPYTAFMVVGRNSSYTMYWLSPPDSGYSVDDLAPATPALFAGEYASGTATLHWGPNGETDLAGYRLHRGTTLDFTPGPGNLVAEPADTGYVDVAGARYYYKLCAVDVHGNASGYAALLPTGTTGVDDPAPAVLSLSLASANPARGGATLRWALPAEADAWLVVYDLAGRLVRELARGRASAGEHTNSWDGRDGSGMLAPAGMYVARLEAAGRGLSVRLVLVR